MTKYEYDPDASYGTQIENEYEINLTSLSYSQYNELVNRSELRMEGETEWNTELGLHPREEAAILDEQEDNE